MATLVKPVKVFYVDRAGKRVPKGTAGAKKVKEKARKWYAQGVPGYPPRKRIPLASDKTVAQQMLADLVKRGERGEAGLEDKATDAQRVELSRHLADYEAHLRAKDVTDKHAGTKINSCRRVIDECGFKALSDISASKVEQFLSGMRAHGKALPPLTPGKEWYRKGEVAALLGVTRSAVGHLIRRHRLAATGNGKARRYPRETVKTLHEQATAGNSIQTANQYLGQFKSFCRWLVDEDKLTRNPLAKLRAGNVALDRRHDRRSLATEELGRLLNVAADSNTAFRGTVGPDRHALYLTACGTGFRRKELASLTPAHFDLDTTPPVVKLAAKRGKNRKPVVQPLPPEVAEFLRTYLAGKPRTEAVWPGGWSERAADMLRVDLDAASIPYSIEGPDGPLFADFHALRHTYITRLEQAGVTIKQAQVLARHSDPKLTIGRYSHATLTELGNALGKLSNLTTEGTADGELLLSRLLPPATVERW